MGIAAGNQMDIKTKEIILRHLKGIVNELERDVKRQKESEQFKIYEENFDRRDVNRNIADSKVDLP